MEKELILRTRQSRDIDSTRKRASWPLLILDHAAINQEEAKESDADIHNLSQDIVCLRYNWP